MTKVKAPLFYEALRKNNPDVFDALENLGRALRSAGPLDERTSHLVGLAAAAAIRSEGAVHSHTRRALAAGVRPDEIRHALLLLLSTVGLPGMVAASSWANDVISKRPRR
jgi:alkylhydroperoxidase/carboxymuconolactone decarboxylase family protein YurZ